MNIVKKICPKCGWNASGETANFCWKDGTKYEIEKPEQEIRCSCGHKLSSVDAYCESCGTITDYGRREADEKNSPIRERYHEDEIDEAREIEAELGIDENHVPTLSNANQTEKD